ncbi:hypothetical protein OPT61_g7207 [Boeremia exigua]|uniref:Uncharacterized protein n=1 Tax=Boeremia exigua TaxID=749465 RepID=A0ACC2I3D0_9PLEO|nr:hypothetical protein OPT61_g7207 [Boeremia exigua]
MMTILHELGIHRQSTTVAVSMEVKVRHVKSTSPCLRSKATRSLQQKVSTDRTQLGHCATTFTSSVTRPAHARAATKSWDVLLNLADWLSDTGNPSNPLAPRVHAFTPSCSTLSPLFETADKPFARANTARRMGNHVASSDLCDRSRQPKMPRRAHERRKVHKTTSMLYNGALLQVTKMPAMVNNSPINLSTPYLLGYVVVLYVGYKVAVAIRSNAKIRKLGARAPVRKTYFPLGLDMAYEVVTHALNDKSYEMWVKMFDKWAGSGRYTVEAGIGERVILTAEPENIKAILATQFKDYGKGEQFRKDWHMFLGNGIFTTDSTLWHNSRQLIRPQFVKDRLSDIDIFETHTQVLISKLVNCSSVDTLDMMFRYTLDAATHFLLGASVDSLHHPQTKFADAFYNAQRVQSIVARVGPLNWLVPRKRMGFYASIATIDDFVSTYIDRALALSADELSEKNQPRLGLHLPPRHRGLHARPPDAARPARLGAASRPRHDRLHAQLGDLPPLAVPQHHGEAAPGDPGYGGGRAEADVPAPQGYEVPAARAQRDAAVVSRGAVQRAHGAQGHDAADWRRTAGRPADWRAGWDAGWTLGLLDAQELDVHPVQRRPAYLHRPAVCADGDGLHACAAAAAILCDRESDGWRASGVACGYCAAAGEGDWSRSVLIYGDPRERAQYITHTVVPEHLPDLMETSSPPKLSASLPTARSSQSRITNHSTCSSGSTSSLKAGDHTHYNRHSSW